jgi:uncharacterized integral membrane protein (TIGR00697 family)
MALHLTIALYVACDLIANITAIKPVAIGSIVVPGGVFLYALTFTLLDLINEQLGRRGTRKVVYGAFVANALLALYSALLLAAPSPAFFTGQEALETVLGSTPRIVGASLAAFLISSLLDVELFAQWKQRTPGHKWSGVLFSNSISTAVDSVVFVLVAFWGVFPVVPLIMGQYLVKMGMAVLSVPLIYAGGAGTKMVERRTD